MMADHDSQFDEPQTGSVSVESPGLSDELLDLDAGQAMALYQTGRLVTASLDLEATLEAIVEATHRLIGSDTTALALIEDDGSLMLRSGRGSLHTCVGGTLDVDHGVAATAIRERRAILVTDMHAEPNGAGPDPDARPDVRTFLAVPVIWQLELLGVVTVALSTPNALGPSEVALAGALAEQAAAAVRHARDDVEERRLRDESQEILRQFSEQAAQLERVQEQLIQNEKLTAIGQLVQGLAHEMNTPLSVVITNLSVLGRHAENLFAVAGAAQQVLPQLLADPLAAALAGPLDTAIRGADLEYTLEDLPELLTDSTAAVRRVADLVRSMANFARRDTGGPSTVAVEEVLEAALTLASNPLKQCAKIVREFAPTPPVLGLTSELTELFLHLLINAAQALEDCPGTVTLTTAYEAGCVVVRIHDTGRGISAEQLTRVFDPFFTTRPVGGGTGMGLAVCYGIVARHRGSIAIDSQPGSGTTVTVRLPAAE
jgi:two-component system, NtrC family, sensor kinase